MSWKPDATDTLCVNTIRALSIDAVQQANSGHPGLPMGAAPMAYVLWKRHLRHDPADPEWADRDRFVLSAGHGSALLYSLLHLSGYDLSMEQIRNFRQWGSLTPGHPEAILTVGVEATTGPLGQGTAISAGMALAERRLADMYGSSVVDHRTYALVSDGDLMEGLSAEAASLAGHLGLGRLTYLYDSNLISLDGPTSLSFTEDVAARYRSYGWHVLEVEDGDTDLVGIDQAIEQAKAETARPSLIVVRTTIGYGSPNKAGSSSAHGSPLGDEEVALTKKSLGWDYEQPFTVPDEAAARFAEMGERGAELRKDWQARYDAFAESNAKLAEQWRMSLDAELPSGWDGSLPTWSVGDKDATRSSAGTALQQVAAEIPWLIGGDADLSSSTKTRIKDSEDFSGSTGSGRNIRFGVREHAMGSICNGIAYHGGLRAYASTFFVFSDYMRPPVRLAALDHLPVVYVWTHDSVAVGEDGPTHQPIEQLAALRAIPNLHVIRPADPNEASAAWRCAMLRNDGPTALVLTRQKVPVLETTAERAVEGVERGAYVIADPPDARALLIATGSEVSLAMAAQVRLSEQGIPVRVVSMPCWERFEQQSDAYQQSVLPPSIGKRVSIEAGSTFGWSRWTGDAGYTLGIDRFGASAPGGTNLTKLGFNVDAVEAAVREILGG